MGRGLSWGQRGESGCVPTGFRYARRSDEPLKQKTLGVRPSCFPGLISTAYIHPAGTSLLLCLTKPEFADQHLLTQGVSGRGAGSTLQRNGSCFIGSNGLCIVMGTNLFIRLARQSSVLSEPVNVVNTVFLCSPILLSEGDMIVNPRESVGYAQTLCR